MTKDKVHAFVDRTIGSLCHNSVDINFIIERLKVNADKYREILEREDSSTTKKNYLVWYIQFAEQRIQDIQKIQKVAVKINKNRPDQIFKLIQLKEKLQHIPQQKVVQFD